MTNRYISILHVTKSFDAALDGQNRWKFYWIDLIDSARRQLGDTAFAGKLYHRFQVLNNRMMDQATEYSKKHIEALAYRH